MMFIKKIVGVKIITNVSITYTYFMLINVQRD